MIDDKKLLSNLLETCEHDNCKGHHDWVLVQVFSVKAYFTFRDFPKAEAMKDKDNITKSHVLNPISDHNKIDA